MKNKSAGQDEDSIDELFKFQNISAGQYHILDNIITRYPNSGLLIAVYEAYFWGTVNGKRLERRRIKNRLTQTKV